MPDAHLAGRHARIDVSLDGVTLTRAPADAERLGVEPVRHLDWVLVTGAVVQTTRKGRTVVRVQVGDAPLAGHRDDPLAVRVRRRDTHLARALVEEINAEVEGRRRWTDGSGKPA